MNLFLNFDVFGIHIISILLIFFFYLLYKNKLKKRSTEEDLVMFDLAVLNIVFIFSLFFFVNINFMSAFDKMKQGIAILLAILLMSINKLNYLKLKNVFLNFVLLSILPMVLIILTSFSVVSNQYDFIVSFIYCFLFVTLFILVINRIQKLKKLKDISTGS